MACIVQVLVQVLYHPQCLPFCGTWYLHMHSQQIRACTSTTAGWCTQYRIVTPAQAKARPTGSMHSWCSWCHLPVHYLFLAKTCYVTKLWCHWENPGESCSIVLTTYIANKQWAPILQHAVTATSSSTRQLNTGLLSWGIRRWKNQKRWGVWLRLQLSVWKW